MKTLKTHFRRNFYSIQTSTVGETTLDFQFCSILFLPSLSFVVSLHEWNPPLASSHLQTIQVPTLVGESCDDINNNQARILGVIMEILELKVISLPVDEQRVCMQWVFFEFETLISFWICSPH